MTGGDTVFKVQPEQKWWDDGSVAIVTGANKGIGKAIAQILASNGLTTIVAARDEGRGTQAVADLKKDTGSSAIHFEQLEISDPASVEKFANTVKAKYDKIAILVNNAGFAYKGNAFGAKEARHTLDINFVGTADVCEKVLPLLADGGRIVNVCSMAGKRRIIKGPKLLERFQSASSLDDVKTLADEFVAAIESSSGSQGLGEWPGSMYGVSKLCEATYTKILAEKAKRRSVDVNACCPGYVNTDMSSGRGTKTVTQGADTPAWLALLAPKGTTGKFFSERSEESF
jgi:carbonyl reductase 1